MKWVCCLLFFISVLSCHNGPATSGILSNKAMQEVYWDIIVADVKTAQYPSKDSTMNDSVKNAGMQQQIFSMHHTTREQFYKSLDYYRSDKDKMDRLLDSMVSLANRVRYAPQNNKPAVPQNIKIDKTRKE
jgi:hypothetical protein